MFLARAAHRRVDLSVQWQAEMERGTHNAVVKLTVDSSPLAILLSVKGEGAAGAASLRATGDIAPCSRRHCAVQQETLLRAARVHAPGRRSLRSAGRQEIVRYAGSKSRCGRRQDVAAGGSAVASGRSCRTGGRSRSTGAGSVASARRQETLLRVAGKEPMHRAASVIVPDGSRFLRWQAGAAPPCSCSPGAGRQEPPLRQAEGDAAPCGRSSSRWRYCCGRQELLRQQQSPCAGDRSRCTWSEEPPRRAAGHTVGDVAAGGRRRCCKRRVPLRQVAAAVRQEPMRAAGPVINGWRLMWPALTWSGKHPPVASLLGATWAGWT